MWKTINVVKIVKLIDAINVERFFWWKSQTFVSLIHICQFKCTAVNHGWLKWERTKVYCRFVSRLLSRLQFQGLPDRRRMTGPERSCLRSGFFRDQKIIFDVFRTKHELKMSNEKNENLQNVSFNHDSSLLLINYES